MLMCLVVVTSIKGQINSIQTNESPYDYLYAGNMSISINKKNNRMTLYVKSDNQFEDKEANIALGVGTNAAILSLQNLNKAMSKEYSNFKIGSYSFITSCSGYANIVHTGTLEYAAGDYILKNYQISDLMLQLVLRDKNASLGKAECIVEKYSNYTGITLKINLIDFDTSKIISLFPIGHTDDVIKVDKGDILTNEQIKIIAEGIESNLIRKNEDAEFFLRIAK